MKEHARVFPTSSVAETIAGGHTQGQLVYHTLLERVDLAREEGSLGVGGYHIRPPHTTHTALHHQSLVYIRHQQDVAPVRGFLP
jgi:hypothetical protein